MRADRYGETTNLSPAADHEAVPRLLTLYTACTPCTASTSHAAWDVDTAVSAGRSGGTGHDGRAKVVEGVSGRAGREGLEEGAGGFGAPADLAASLIDAAVVTQQVQYLPQRIVVVQVAVQQLEQPGIGRVGRLAGQQRRQRRDALAKISSGRLAGVIAGDVDDVVAELEHHTNLLAEVGHDPLQVRSRTGDLGTEQCRRRDQGAGFVRHDL